MIFSLEANKAANPRMGLYYKNVSRAEATGDNEVTFYFDVKNNRELPMIMGQLTILPKHWWTGKDASGNQRDPMKTTLEPPLGSGPYRIKEVKPGRSIAYERVKDYWGKDLPVNAGQWNYDTIRFEYYRDETVAFESFKAGNLDYWQETSAKNWATAYDFAAVRDGLRQAAGGGARAHAADAVLRAQSQAPAICRPPRAAGVQSRLRLRVGEQESVLRAICAGRQLLPGRRARRAAEAAARDASSRS